MLHDDRYFTMSFFYDHRHYEVLFPFFDLMSYTIAIIFSTMETRHSLILNDNVICSCHVLTNGPDDMRNYQYELDHQVAPSRLEFIRDMINIIDFIATMSFYSDIILQRLAADLENAGQLR